MPRAEGVKQRSGKIFKFFLYSTISTIFLALFCSEFLRDDVRKSLNQIFVKFKSAEDQRLKYWPVAQNYEWNPSGSLRTMNRVFKRLNFLFVNVPHDDNWDIAWSIEYPYNYNYDEKKKENKIFAGLGKKILEKHQKFNHFPGTQNLVVKSRMAFINRESKYILPSFDLPDEFEYLQDFIKMNPHKKILEKNIYNRGVVIVDTKDIKISQIDEVYYQQFMDKPFLIDGHAFDFGVFVLITSFDPLRVYRYGEVLLRFCEEKYYPFDVKNRKKYVVEDNSIPPFEMPSFMKVYEKYGFSVSMIFENIIKSKGFDVKKFWNRIDDAISSIVMNSENRVINEV
jgi:tubulin monoglycylase TTLL15